MRKNLARRVAHNIIQLIAVREAIQIIANASRPKVSEIPELLPVRPPDWLFTSYPLPDQREQGV